ncbi:unnamed protein product [Menidia menidia]|uniref:(Atlantic silverside) hypothetical protein n=1 Tax=Menidia menidia TaxID=238744 RepID=A0A8S4BTT9_9TELE|nr:unnamed protein product [Menidia menidia]
MEEMITLSSDDSDVEIVGSYSEFTSKADPLPLSDVRVDIEAVNVNIPPHFIDLTDPRWTFPDLKLRKTQHSTSTSVIDLTENDSKETELKTENLSPADDIHLEKYCTDIKNISIKQDSTPPEISVKDSSDKAPQQDCGAPDSKRHLNSDAQLKEPNLKEPSYFCHDTTAVKLTRLPFLETHVRELKNSGRSIHLTKQSLCFIHPENEKEPQECDVNLRATAALNVSESSTEGPPQEEKSTTDRQESRKNISNAQCQDESHHCQTPVDPLTSEEESSEANSVKKSTNESQPDGFPSADHLKAQSESLYSKLTNLELDQTESKQSCPSLHSPKSSSAHANTPEWDMETETYREDIEMDSPSSLLWQGESDGEELNDRSRPGMDYRAVSREDRQYVSPAALNKVLSGQAQALINEGNGSFGTAEVLCRQSLSLVYSTIEENYPEGTLQLLSDLLQPGYYPPKDIMSHLLRGILLDPLSPYHLSVQAFNLLMRTQRHHMVGKRTIPWDWDLLTSVLSDQDSTKKPRCEIVRMFLEYTVQTLEDDFWAKCSSSGPHHSIAKAMLSCDQQFTRVRDIIKWLFTAIMKSTEHEKSKETTREKDEHIRIVAIFQRMLSIALEVDHSPTLHSTKLSQELFHTLLSHAPLRAHRLLLLESLESKLLRCKLLEHLLDYACPQKVTLPMSLSLLLHFLKSCTLEPDPTDGTERWQRWEELIHLLWMLLLSYNKAMKGYLRSSSGEQRSRAGTSVYRPEDTISKPAVREAVEAFLSRSRADLGGALPLHVEESLTYLQDHLLDVCQC